VQVHAVRLSLIANRPLLRGHARLRKSLRPCKGTTALKRWQILSPRSWSQHEADITTGICLPLLYLPLPLQRRRYPPVPLSFSASYQTLARPQPNVLIFPYSRLRSITTYSSPLTSYISCHIWTDKFERQHRQRWYRRFGCSHRSQTCGPHGDGEDAFSCHVKRVGG
jgi:hypothetical protein